MPSAWCVYCKQQVSWMPEGADSRDYPDEDYNSLDAAANAHAFGICVPGEGG